MTVELMCENAPLYDVMQPELMFAAKPLDLTKADAVVVGCGMGFSEKALARFKEAIAAPVPLIIDGRCSAPDGQTSGSAGRSARQEGAHRHYTASG